MKKILSVAIVMSALVLSGCIAGGAQYVDLYYTGKSEVSKSGKLGISTFSDERPDTEADYLGTRDINKNKKETFFSIGGDVASSVTKVCKSYLQDVGFNCTSIAPWDHSPGGVKESRQRLDFLVGGTIKKLDCFAMKKTGFTSLILDIDMVIYIGTPDKSEVKKVPVQLKLERNEIIFSNEKLQDFMNNSLLEVIQNALSFS